MRLFIYMLAFTLALWGSSAKAQKYTHSVNNGFFSGKTVKGSNVYVTKQMTMASFDKLCVSLSANVEFVQTEGKPSVTVVTSDNILPLLNIHVNKDCLYVGFKDKVNVQYNKLDIKVTAPNIRSLLINGSGDVHLSDVRSDELKLRISGSGDVDFGKLVCTGLDVVIAGSGDVEGKTLQSDQLSISIAGSGDIQLNEVRTRQVKASIAGSGTLRMAGTADTAHFSVSGSGDVFAENLETGDVEASVSGSGEIRCYATDNLKARSAGSGCISYRGDPKVDYPMRGLKKLK